jgi:hypothetical protein
MTIPGLLGASTESLPAAVAPSRHQTAIILDWDDTLLCSTWLANNDLRLDNVYMLKHEHRQELLELEKRVQLFLERAISLASSVFLVTNAETGWVELSCERFLPGIAALLPKVKVVSARSKYEENYPNQPCQWKVQAFREELCEFIRLSNETMMETEGGDAKIANVISIGDSHHEREALHIVTSEWDNILVKSVKFVERPDMEVLRKQIDLIHGCIEYICQHGGDLDLMLSHSLLMSPSSTHANWAANVATAESNTDIDGIAAANGL